MRTWRTNNIKVQLLVGPFSSSNPSVVRSTALRLNECHSLDKPFVLTTLWETGKVKESFHMPHRAVGSFLCKFKECVHMPHRQWTCSIARQTQGLFHVARHIQKTSDMPLRAVGSSLDRQIQGIFPHASFGSERVSANSKCCRAKFGAVEVSSPHASVTRLGVRRISIGQAPRLSVRFLKPKLHSPTNVMHSTGRMFSQVFGEMRGFESGPQWSDLTQSAKILATAGTLWASREYRASQNDERRTQMHDVRLLGSLQCEDETEIYPGETVTKNPAL